MSRVLTYDLGGSSLRVGVVENGRSLRRMVQIPQVIEKNESGGFEADPELWWGNFCAACRQLQAQGEDLSAIDAVAGCGFTRTQVFVDAAGRVVHPAITFQDSRGAPALAAFVARAPADLDPQAAGLSPFHPVARLLWLQAQRPEAWARVARVLEPKDFINLRLTGETRSDRISQHALTGFLDLAAADPALARALDMPRDLCPEPIGPFDQVGQVRAAGLPAELAPLAGKPVFCGSNDTWTCVLGSGGLNPGAAYAISGTSDVFGVITADRFAAEGLLTVRWGPAQWQLGGPSQGAATKLGWARDRFLPGADLRDAVTQGFAGDRLPPLFLPYLEGERTPFWDSGLRGAFVGLNDSHGNREMFRAVAEGLNFLSRLILERAEAATGIHSGHVCFAGGLANNATLSQLKADILNRPVCVPAVGESGLMGAAQVALHAVDDIGTVTETILRDGRWYTPDPARRDRLDAWFDLFRASTDALRDVSHRMAAAPFTHN